MSDNMRVFFLSKKFECAEIIIDDTIDVMVEQATRMLIFIGDAFR